MTVIPLLFLLFATIAANPLKPGDPFPELKGELLSGQTATLPNAVKGKIALLVLGFSRESRQETEPWTKRYRAEFAKDDRVACYAVPMIGPGGRFAKLFIMAGMKRDLPKSLHNQFMVVFSDTDPWKARVSLKGQNDAYLILLDGAGTVRWMYNGSLDEGHFQELAATTRRLIQ